MSKIIALCGERKSGKDFFCEHLERVEEGVQRLSFSDEVRRLACELHPWLPFYFSPEEKDKPFLHPNNPRRLTPRDIWLNVGKVREVEPDYFVKRFKTEQYEQFDGKMGIITDFRTPEEYAFLKEAGIPIFKIVRVNREGIEPCLFEAYIRSFDKFDDIFYNHLDGTDAFMQFWTSVKGAYINA